MPSTVAQSPAISPLAGQRAPKEILVDLAELEGEYYARRPDLDEAQEMMNRAPAS